MQALWSKANIEKKESYLCYPPMADGQTVEISLEWVHLFSGVSIFFLGERLQVKDLSLRLIFKRIFNEAEILNVEN